MNWVTEEILEGYALKGTRVNEESRRLCAEGHTCKRVTEESLEGYALKDACSGHFQIWEDVWFYRNIFGLGTPPRS